MTKSSKKKKMNKKNCALNILSKWITNVHTGTYVFFAPSVTLMITILLYCIIRRRPQSPAVQTHELKSFWTVPILTAFLVYLPPPLPGQNMYVFCINCFIDTSHLWRVSLLSHLYWFSTYLIPINLMLCQYIKRWLIDNSRETIAQKSFLDGHLLYITAGTS